MTEKLAAELIAKANGARKKSYCPYSKKSVGAALLCADGSIFTGANIENSAFSPSVCAERVALFSAIHEGKREFLAIAVSGGDIASPPEGFTPCGVCRQTLSEFANGDFIILVEYPDGYKKYTLSELLPSAFGL